MYPKYLNPAHAELFQLEGKAIEIPKCIIQFQKWIGPRVKESFSSKSIVSVDGKPMFPEVAILHYFNSNGWEARWIETYGKRNKEPVYLAEWKDVSLDMQSNEPIVDKKVVEVITGISKLNNNSYLGCWDVLAWKDGRIIFTEAKRNNKDLLNQGQDNWLAAGIAFGLRPENFLLVQWDYNPRCM